MALVKNDAQTIFTVTDPRYFDGDPYQVAERALEQCAAVAAILRRCVEQAEIMARNAELERAEDMDAAAREWPESLQGKRLAEIKATSERFERQLALLARAASFNPKARLPKGE
jgi:hypothetical protein